MQDNPFSGPAHHVALANAIERERRPGAYTRPPPTGGEQLSLRLSDRLTKHVAVLAEAADWTRAQVLTALLERGLFDLYDQLSDERGEQLLQQCVAELPPVMHAESLLQQEARRLAREVAGPAVSLSPGQRPEQFWILGAPERGGIPRVLVVVERLAAEDFKNGRPSDQARALARLREELRGVWGSARQNAGQELRHAVTSALLLPGGADDGP